MGKNFAPRESKKSRKTLDMSDLLSRDLFQVANERLLEGAKLDKVKLKDIVVKEQVRTKFNDSSLKELADNIKVNGLIQPLVVHLENNKYTLICGERRFRAMNLIKFDEAPCFILTDKTPQELMAIQFSENSAREELHYIDKADGILNYQKATKASERKIVKALGISKTEVHRSLLLAKLPDCVKEAAKSFNIEKYVLLEYGELKDDKLKKVVEQGVVDGQIVKRSQLRKVLKEGGLVNVIKGQKKTSIKKRGRAISTNTLIKKLQSNDVDKETKEKIRLLLEGESAGLNS